MITHPGKLLFCETYVEYAYMRLTLERCNIYGNLRDKCVVNTRNIYRISILRRIMYTLIVNVTTPVGVVLVIHT